MIDPSFLEQLKELDFLVKKRVSSSYTGGRASLKHGKGIEVVDYREYFPGDDFRLIDWRVFARTEKLYIRRFEEEKELTMHMLLDSSSSMNFTTHKMTKFDFAGSIAAGFGFLSVHNHEKFGMGLYSSSVREVAQPKKSQVHLFNMIDLINSLKLSGETDLGVSASQYVKLMKTKAFTVIISDFLEDLNSIKEGLYRMARHSSEMILVQVLDPWEIDLGWNGDIKFQDLETGEEKRTFLSPGFRKDYVAQVTEHNAKIRRIADDLGVSLTTLTTNEPIFESFIKIVGGGRRGG